jgi:hypothetical protein
MGSHPAKASNQLMIMSNGSGDLLKKANTKDL